MSEKIYNVPAEWTKRAFINKSQYRKMYERSLADPNGFWAEEAKRIHWMKPFSKVENTSFRQAATFSSSGSRMASPMPPTTASIVICTAAGNQTAIIWEGDDPKQSKRITYKELHDEVCRFANILRTRNVKKGDRVTIYLPMIPRSRLRDARLRAHRRHPFGGVRRLLTGCARRTHRGPQIHMSSSPRMRASAAAAKSR